MAELVALLTQIGDPPSGIHLHIVTDQHNLDTNFPEIEIPNTLYKISYWTHFLGSKVLIDLPSIQPHRIRLSSILSMLVVVAVSPQIEGLGKSQNRFLHIDKLLHGVNSARNLIMSSELRRKHVYGEQAPYYFRGPFTIFWLSDEIPDSEQNFPTKSFFTRNLGSKYGNPFVHTVVFMIKFQNHANQSADSNIIFFCAHCSITYSVKFITVGVIADRGSRFVWASKSMLRSGTFQSRLIETITIMAPVEFIVHRHSTFSFPFTSTCETSEMQPHPFERDFRAMGFYCGTNFSIRHLPIEDLSSTLTIPTIHDESYYSGYAN